MACRCPTCFTVIEPEHTCRLCESFPLPWSELRTLWDYEDRVRRFITTMKYQPSLSLAKLAGLFLAEATPLLFPEHRWDGVVPIPIRSKTLNERKFNQCVIIGEPLAERFTNSALLYAALSFHRGVTPHASLSAKARLADRGRVFKVSPSFIRGKRLLLVDDVITTGATLAAASRALSEGGASRIDVITLAQSNQWGTHRSSLS